MHDDGIHSIFSMHIQNFNGFFFLLIRVSPGFEGQSMFLTVATQTPRNSRFGAICANKSKQKSKLTAKISLNIATDLNS